jgi:hypothetical protein
MSSNKLPVHYSITDVHGVKVSLLMMALSSTSMYGSKHDAVVLSVPVAVCAVLKTYELNTFNRFLS